MEDTIVVITSDCRLGTSPQILRTLGIGSCVAVCLYDHVSRIGGLMHILVPSVDYPGSNQFRAANTGIPRMTQMLQEFGARCMTAKIVGGAHMFTSIQTGPDDIGSKNTDAVRGLLAGCGISIIAEDIGGSVGRNVDFFLENGIVEITTKL